MASSSSPPRSPTSILSDGNMRIATGERPRLANGIFVGGRPPRTCTDYSNEEVRNSDFLDSNLSFQETDINCSTEVADAVVPLESDDTRKIVLTIVEEYFSTGDVEQVASDLRDLECHPYFVRKLISMAMDRHDKEKEMASILLSALYNDVLSPSKIKQGFLILLESSDDLAVDIPDAVNILALFIARAIVDEILPPIFPSQAKKLLLDSSKGFDVLQISEKSYLSAPHHAELLQNRWGGTTQINVETAKAKIRYLLREYIENGDVLEACRCMRDLSLPFFHHEVVKQALILAMEIPSSEQSIIKLLKVAAQEGLISPNQLTKGFSRLVECLDDLTLDIPSAKTIFKTLVAKVTSGGWINTYSDSVVQNGDNRSGANEKIQRFKKECANIIYEYFLSDDIPELIRSLQELALPEYNSIFIKKLITLAMDRRNREKEMTSVLLSALSMDTFSSNDIINGFVMLLQSAEDTSLDIVDAPNALALFLARAVIDEVLVPLNLDEISRILPEDSKGSETVRIARSLVSARHAGERILRCWGGGTGWAIEDAKDKIAKLLEEYEAGGDLAEACRCIHDLGMPFFYHEVVKKALVLAMEKQNDSILYLLHKCFAEGLITTNQMSKGFSRVTDSLDDLSLDIPNAKKKFEEYLKYATHNGWISPTTVLAK